MKRAHSKCKTKYIILITTILMLCVFVMPKYVYAAKDKGTDTSFGGILLSSISKLITFICDETMQWLQDTFVSLDDIEKEDGTYNFQYSPAIIFSGTVPALDVNFISPNEDIEQSSALDRLENYVKDMHNIVNWRSQAKSGNNQYKVDYDNAKNDSKYSHISGKYPYMGAQMIEYDIYYLYNEATNAANICCQFESNPHYYYSTTLSLNNRVVVSTTYESTAIKLQRTISTWYKALRRIALVGLLSVLVYIGIRIVLTATSPQEQSKYKKMMVDWLVALCLLFTLHYIMVLALTATQEISKIFNTGETDTLLNNLRYDISEAHGSDVWGEVVGQVIMYAALVILTIMFTVKYIKRVIYMAFFTMIAPLITLTYPLDKIKDGQAQAFTMWIREFTFNALIQVVHLVIYYVLVGSALTLVGTYPVYAIVALMFMNQAENVIKRMFGFDKAETVGAMGAAVTGGLVSNAITQMKKGSKSGGSSGKEDGSKPVRTVEKDPLAGLRNGVAGTNASGQGENSAGTTTNGGAERTAPIRAAEAFAGEESNQGELNNAGESGQGEIPENKPQAIPKRNILRGVTAVGKRYVGPAIRTASGGAGALVGGTIGFAAGVAQGDMGKALGGALGGLAAGNAIGQRAANLPKGVVDTAFGIADGIRGIRDTSIEGEYGEETIEELRNVGITNEKDINKIIENSNGDISKEIGYYTLAKKCPRQIYDDDKKLEEYLRNLGLSETSAREIRDNMRKYR